MALFVPAVLLAAAVAQQPSNPAPQENSQTATQRVVANVDPAMQAELRRLFKDIGMDELLQMQFERMMAPIATMLKGNPQLTQQFVDEFVRRCREKMLDGRVQDVQMQEYAKFFTREDIQQMIAYQESPIGRKANQVMPQLMTELATQLQDMGESIGKEVATEVARDHPEYLRQSAPRAAPGGVIGSVVGAVPSAPPAPSGPNQSRNQSADSKVRVAGSIMEAQLIKKVDPEYPPLAKSARVQGRVEFTAIIGTDGKVESLTLVGGHPLLINAAKQAVMQWEYKPVIMNGQPVEVVTDVIVNFHLDASDK